MTEEKRKETFIDKFKKHPISVVLLLVASIAVGIGALTEGIDKTISFYEKHFNDKTLNRPDKNAKIPEKQNAKYLNSADQFNGLASWHTPLKIMANQKASSIHKLVEDQFQSILNFSNNGALQLYSQHVFMTKDIDARDSVEHDYLRNIIYDYAGKNDFISNKLPTLISARSGNESADNGLALTDKNGNMLIATSGFSANSALREKVNFVASEGRPELFDILLNENGMAAIGFAVPLYGLESINKKSNLIGILLGYKNAETFLFPLLKSTELTLKTDEAMLVSLRNNQIVYLSPLSDGIKPMSKLIGSENLHLAAPYSYQNPGQYKILEDYAGNMVLCTGRKIAGTPWVLVQKINAKEISARF